MASGNIYSGKSLSIGLCISIVMMLGVFTHQASAADINKAATVKPVSSASDSVTVLKKTRIAKAAQHARLSPAAGKSEQYDEYDDYNNDPFESYNRVIYQFNYAIDSVVIRPITVVYRTVMPRYGRMLVSNFMDNLYTPVTLANSILQGDPYNSFASFWRFVINSTIGLGGIFDVADEAGLMMRQTDMGMTFAMWGADSGGYIMLPLIGPSNVRDAFGRLGDIFFVPSSYYDTATTLTVGGVTAIDARSRYMKSIDDVYRTSLDPYATFRSAYTQKRDADIIKQKRARKASLAKATTQ